MLENCYLNLKPYRCSAHNQVISQHEESRVWVDCGFIQRIPSDWWANFSVHSTSFIHISPCRNPTSEIVHEFFWKVSEPDFELAGGSYINSCMIMRRKRSWRANRYGGHRNCTSSWLQVSLPSHHLVEDPDHFDPMAINAQMELCSNTRGKYIIWLRRDWAWMHSHGIDITYAGNQSISLVVQIKQSFHWLPWPAYQIQAIQVGPFWDSSEIVAFPHEVDFVWIWWLDLAFTKCLSTSPMESRALYSEGGPLHWCHLCMFGISFSILLCASIHTLRSFI